MGICVSFVIIKSCQNYATTMPRACDRRNQLKKRKMGIYKEVLFALLRHEMAEVNRVLAMRMGLGCRYR